MGNYLIPVLATFAIGLFITPIVKYLAVRFNFVDNPEARKMHKKAIPLLGGLAIFATFILGLFFFYQGQTNLNLKGVVIGGALIFLLGFWDDRTGGIPWKIKLLFQMFISVITVVVFDIKISLFELSILNVLVSGFWLTALTNSLNLMDNMDGLSAGVASIAAFFYFLLAHKAGQYDLAMFSILLSVSAFSFLKYNFSPASIFMGDMGSMFLGFILGCIAIQLQVTELANWRIVSENISFGQYQVVTSLIPMLVIALPLFDTALVSVLRVLNGLKISTPGKDHSSHRLTYLKGKMQRVIDKAILSYIRVTKRKKSSQHHISRAISQTRSVLILYAIGLFFGVSALVVSQLSLVDILGLLLIMIFLAIIGARKLAEVAVYDEK